MEARSLLLIACLMGLTTAARDNNVKDAASELISSARAINYIAKTRMLGDVCTSSHSCRQGIRDSVCQHGVCTCLPYHVAFNATTCLPTSLLGFECTTHSQCSIRVPHSGCIDGFCQCSKGYTAYRRHICLPPSALGTKCFSDDQCQLSDRSSYCKFIIPNLYGRCHCKASAQHIGKKCVKPRLMLNSTCSTTVQCETSVKHSICRDSVCTCDYGYTSGWTQDRCIPTFKGLDENRSFSTQKIGLGQPCSTWAQCQAADPNSACLNGLCQCFFEGSCNSNNTGCHPLTFQCRSTGQCISRSLTCNGVADCHDGSDEECNHSQCPVGSFRCVATAPKQCVSSMFVCDGKQHCADGSDEADCQVTGSQECPGTSFKCDDGTCVPEHAFCNSIVDCKDGSDEPEAACKREFRTREEDYCPFRCHNGRCRSASILCTQSDGCGDQSDELQCQVCRCPPINNYSPSSQRKL